MNKIKIKLQNNELTETKLRMDVEPINELKSMNIYKNKDIFTIYTWKLFKFFHIKNIKKKKNKGKNIKNNKYIFFKLICFNIS